MTKLRKVLILSGMIAVLGLVTTTFAQTTAVVRGVVLDQNGAVVPNAKVTLSQASKPTMNQTFTTGGDGSFQFSNLEPAEDYSIIIEAANFGTLKLTNIRAQVAAPTDLSATLKPGPVGATIDVTAGGAELVDTTTANLSATFNSRQTVDLAQTSIGSGVNNLALLSANVTTTGGVGVGTGGSVGGQRARDNNFVVDGIDNNDKAVTGPQVYISPEEVAEFTILTNQFPAEYGRSNGGQFITVTRSGGKDYRGTVYGFFQNRNLNAGEVTRDDRFRGGANLGGPMPGLFTDTDDSRWKTKSQKVFFFTSYERSQTGLGAAALPFFAPTAAGRTALAAIPGLSNNNRSVFLNYMPTAPTNNAGNVVVNGVNIPVGLVSVSAPNFAKQNHFMSNFDINQSSKTSHRIRFTFTNQAFIDTAANLPQFFIALPVKQRLFSYTLIHNFSSTLLNETRIGFRRASPSNFPVGNQVFPGLNAFPNIQIDELGVNIGPDPNAPQTGIENNYQLVDNMTWIRGNHSVRFGGDFRTIISPQTFSQRVRGDYEYSSLQNFLRDEVPDTFAERNAGNNVYYGNQHLFYAFAQDDWRFRPNLTFNLGVNYAYQQVPLGARTSQALNSISSVPGVLVFTPPKTQKGNFAPRVGMAWSPNFSNGWMRTLFGEQGKTSIRAGFSMAYDYIFDNLYILSNPPQLQQTNDCPGSAACVNNFLANGGLPATPVAITSAAVARSVTGSYEPDQIVPYSLAWTGSLQRQFHHDWSVEFRYLGTRGVHLLTQNRINILPKVDPANGKPGLPTFLTAPTQAQLDAMTLTLTQINARPRLDPFYANAGFTSTVVAFLSNGSSIYHGGSVTLQHRFARGFQGTAAYTLSHLIDDTTAEVFSTVLSPRRVQDFRNLRGERATSALDHKHRFVTSWIWDIPWMNKANGLTKTLLGGWAVAGTYTYETGEMVTIRSGNDSNLNGDAAGDRGIFNPAGREGLQSTVTPLTRTDGQVVGYLANNPNARYIQAGAGAVSNLGRNTFQTNAINNVDASIFKNFRMGENRRFQIRADFFNLFNHPQFVPGQVNDVAATSATTTEITQFNAISPITPNFLNASGVFSPHSRVIQVAARFNF